MAEKLKIIPLGGLNETLIAHTLAENSLYLIKN